VLVLDRGSLPDPVGPRQFEAQALAVRDAGRTAILAEYTTFAEGAGTADTVEQGRSILKWVRSHASQLNIDPHRIAVAGASAGSRIAGSTMEPGADGEARTSADALIPFNPAVGPVYPNSALPPPPTIVFHGEDDRQVPVATARSFCTSIEGVCEIATYPGGGHGFFNTEPEYSATSTLTIDFLQRLDWDRTGTS